MEQNCIDRIKDFVEEHLKQEFSLSELAEYAGYSAFHFAREFKTAMGLPVMEYVRVQRVHAAAKDIAGNKKNICDIAMDYCFDTHAGFTKAFIAVYGCTPKDYAEYTKNQKLKTTKGVKLMNTSKIVIRQICKDDVQDLWENVYCAMTPRQITDEKILPSIERYKNGDGVSIAAEVDGKVVMDLPMIKMAYMPMGFIFDNNYISDDGDSDIVMRKMLDELIKQAKHHLNITTLIKPSGENDKSSKAFEKFGFTRAFVSNGWDYLMLAL